MEVKKVQFRLGSEDVIIETGKIAKQTNGSVMVTQGGTTVFCAAVASKKPSTMGFFPLQVNYTEKYYAAGKIPGGFIKREGRPKDKEILVSRLTDRPMRPLFPEGFMNEVQILPTTVSYDGVNQADVLAMIAASASVAVSDIPFDGPLAACRIGYVNNELVVNPTKELMGESILDLIVAGTADAIMMVEGNAKQISEEIFLSAIEKAHEVIKEVVVAIDELAKNVNKSKMDFEALIVDSALRDEVNGCAYDKIKEASKNSDKATRVENISAVIEEAVAHFTNELGKTDDEISSVKTVLHDIEKAIVRKEIVEEGIRPDGRKNDEVRKLTMETGLLPRTHGSSLFTRGQTQAMVVATLGTKKDAQMLDNIEGFSEKHFMLHYNFPPFSVGETGRVGFVGRREVGHGMLAEHALAAVLPSVDDFPYTIRLVSEIMESNGSSSMASVCGGSLALMDAGVPITDAVAGIAMGLVMNDENNYKILTDIQGVEDHLGDMDFKLTGTENGITALQMDIKVKGITFAIFKEAMTQATQARKFILGEMNKVISKPKEDISQYAPKIISLQIDSEKIGAVIGKGGETIRGIQESTGTVINISDDGLISIASPDGAAAENALNIIKAMTAEVEVGQVYEGTAVNITDFGAFIEILPGRDGLCHISKLAKERVNKVTDVIKKGDKLKVRVVDVDKLGRINLSAIDVNE